MPVIVFLDTDGLFVNTVALEDNVKLARTVELELGPENGVLV